MAQRWTASGLRGFARAGLRTLLRAVLCCTVAGSLAGPVCAQDTSQTAAKLFDNPQPVLPESEDLEIASSGSSQDNSLLVAFTKLDQFKNKYVIAIEASRNFERSRQIHREFAPGTFTSSASYVRQRSLQSAIWVEGSRTWVLLGAEHVRGVATPDRFWLWRPDRSDLFIPNRRDIALAQRGPSGTLVGWFENLRAGGSRSPWGNFLVVGHKVDLNAAPDSVRYSVVAFRVSAAALVPGPEIVLDTALLALGEPSPFAEIAVTATSRDENDGWMVVYRKQNQVRKDGVATCAASSSGTFMPLAGADICGRFIQEDGVTPPASFTVLSGGAIGLQPRGCIGRDWDYRNLRVAGMRWSSSAPGAMRVGRYLIAYTRATCPDSESAGRTLRTTRFNWSRPSAGPGFPGVAGSTDFGSSMASQIRLAYEEWTESHWALLTHTPTPGGGLAALFPSTHLRILGHTGVEVHNEDAQLGLPWAHATAFNPATGKFAIVQTRTGSDSGATGVFGWTWRHGRAVEASLVPALSMVGPPCTSARTSVGPGVLGEPYAGHEFFTLELRGAPPSTPVRLQVAQATLPGVPRPCEVALALATEKLEFPTTTDATGVARVQLRLSDDGAGVFPFTRPLLGVRRLTTQWVWSVTVPVPDPISPGTRTVTQTSDAWQLVVGP